MKKIFCSMIIMIVGYSAIAFCADLVIDTKTYNFNYEIVQAEPAETFVVKKKAREYKNPLVVGFKILPDGTIAAIDEYSRKAQAAPSKKIIAETHPAPKENPDYNRPYYNNDWLVIEQVNGDFWAVMNGVPNIDKSASVPLDIQTEKTNKIGPFTVYFDLNSSHLTSKDSKWLNSLPTIYPNAGFEVTGFTCSKGSIERNTKLAANRAKAVALKLAATGATVTEESKPMCCYISQKALWENRRVEIFVRQPNL